MTRHRPHLHPSPRADRVIEAIIGHPTLIAAGKALGYVDEVSIRTRMRTLHIKALRLADCPLIIVGDRLAP